MTKEDSPQQNLDFFDRPVKKRIQKHKNLFTEERYLLVRKLNEVISGKRSRLKVYSSLLKKHLWIVNEGLINLKKNDFDEEVITMKRLVELCYKGTK